METSSVARGRRGATETPRGTQRCRGIMETSSVARGRRGSHKDVEGHGRRGTGASRGARGVERHTEMSRGTRGCRGRTGCRGGHGDAATFSLMIKPLALRARGLSMSKSLTKIPRRRRETHGDAERHTGTPSDFGQAFAHGQAPRPKGEGLDHERKGCRIRRQAPLCCRRGLGVKSA